MTTPEMLERQSEGILQEGGLSAIVQAMELC